MARVVPTCRVCALDRDRRIPPSLIDSAVRQRIARRSSHSSFRTTHPRDGRLHPDVSVTNDLQKRAEAVLGYTFVRPELLKESLTHASIAETRLHSNERMEF